MLNHKGEVASAPVTTSSWCAGGALHAALGCRDSRGRDAQAVIDLAREAGIDVREVPLTKHDVYVADECFLTGTAAEVVPVVKVDSRTIGTGKPGPMTCDLKERFHKLTRR